MTRDVLSVEGVHKWFGGQHVLNGVNLTVGLREVLCIVGPSGSGKSTLLRCISHLEPIDDGSISLNGEMIGYEVHRGHLYERREQDLAERRAKIGMVFQSFNLFGHLTALENVAFGPVCVRKMTKTDARDRAMGYLEQVGLSEKRNAYPGELSGGQQQRVAIARALAMEPELILFDEPTSALDPQLVGEVLAVIRDLATQDRTMVIVTHEYGFARDVADNVAVMSAGTVIEHGPPADVLSTRKATLTGNS